MLLFKILNTLIFVLLLFAFRIMAKRHVSFGKRVILSLLVGIIYGLYLHYTYIPIEWLNTVGRSYVALLRMISMPLIMISILSAIINLKDSKEATETGTLVVGTLLFTAAIASIVSIFTTLSFKLNANNIIAGSSEKAAGENILSKVAVVDQTISDKIISFIPTNPFYDMTGARATSIIAVVVFCAFVGFAILGVKKKKPESAEIIIKLINSTNDIVLRMVTIVLRLTPYGVLALIARIIAITDYTKILKLINFVVASYVAIIIMFIIHLIFIIILGLSPITYLKKSMPALTFAFTSRTSAGTIPLTIITQEKLGVEKGIANIAATFGSSIGQNGCASIYPTMLALMIAPTVGIDPFNLAFLTKVVIIVTISSLGVVGVGGGATFAAIIVLSTLGFPVELAGLLISVEPLIDMARTALNVNDSILSGVISARMLNKLNKDQYNSMTN
ncbi:cation:dicarboxylate symporter family transporter [Oceanivirga salmonicida]|uniref:cation:dicarboxylate symporter family transporter n=1 Tax=Oceanivirga salmonicida TaxID=1769291 RepID=UPI00082DDB55|nr:cation:dicarboxylase symporter family transporter [Oceanivirga salmonicida]